jgi:uncharacterized protein (DUF433 family)
MNLPDFLTEAPFGEILVTGHRIGLYHVVFYFNQGYSPERLHEQFPTLSPELIAQILRFYEQNRAEVDAYMARCQQEIDHQRATTPRVLDWAELRRRMESMGPAGKS